MSPAEIFGWVLTILSMIGIGLGVLGLLARLATRRGTWVLNPQAEPHRCRTPTRPRRNALRWRCNTCQQLYEAHAIMLFGETVWTWDEVRPETNMTDRQELTRRIGEGVDDWVDGDIHP